MYRLIKLPGLTLALIVNLTLVGSVVSQQRFITIASTTSTENSGLYEELLPNFFDFSGIEVRVVAVGTGQAINLARRGDADLLLVHHKVSEEEFVEQGYGVKRYDIMYNDFIIVGPIEDPAGIAKLQNINLALSKIADSNSPFASRGDDSGTHKKEQSLWHEAGIDVMASSGKWYIETGSGMGATLNVANDMGAYSLSDRATWLKFANKSALDLLVENDPKLHNQYGITLVNPDLYPHIKAKDGQIFIDWLISDSGQQTINKYNLNGQQAFFANARK